MKTTNFLRGTKKDCVGKKEDLTGQIEQNGKKGDVFKRNPITL